MLKPKVADRQHWDIVSDEELLGRELTTDNPLGLDGLVTELPNGPEEPHVEFSYDLDDEVHCVHGNHRHKHGFIFRKREHRYMVGWMCGEKIYGQKFDQYAADFRAAQTRQDAMRRVREIRIAVERFSNWATSPEWRNSIDTFDKLRGSLLDRMPVVCQTVHAHAGHRLNDALMPRYLCYPIASTIGHPRELNIEREYSRFLEELRTTANQFSKPSAAVAAIVGRIVEDLRGIARRASVLLAKFDDVDTFFQPATLEAICQQIDRLPSRRTKHHASLLKIKNKVISLEMPKDFRPPARRGLEDLELALNAGR
jgi:hypothetical protein